MDVTLETDQDLIDHQLALETDMLTGGIQRFRKARDRSVEAGRESHTAHGRAIVAQLVSAVAGNTRVGSQPNKQVQRHCMETCT